MPNTHVSLTGNLTRDPELKFTQKGDAVVNFSVAVNEGPRDNPKTAYYDIACWQSLATNVADTLKKGMRVVVTGVLNHQTWESPQGEKRSKVQITADAVGPDLRFATAHVNVNQKPAVAPAQVGYPDSPQPLDGLEQARQALGGSYEGTAPRGEPF